jgi:hypothetical protein
MNENYEIIEMGSKKLIEVNNSLIVKKIDPDKVFVIGGLNPLIDAIKEKAKIMVAGLDPSKPKDRKTFGSVCGDISSSKVFVEKKMKEHVEELEKKVKPTNKERIRWCAEMDAVRDETDRPRKEWQAKQDMIIAEAERTMKYLRDSSIVYAETTAAELSIRIEQVENTEIDNLPEDYRENAAKLKDDILAKLYQQQAEVAKREAEAEELRKLRADAAAREEADRKANEEKERLAREEKLKAEAAAKATREAEEKAAADKKAAEESIAKAKRDAEAAEQRRIADAERVRIAEESLEKEKKWRNRLDLIPDVVWNGQEAIDNVSDELIITYEDLLTFSEESFSEIVSRQSSISEARKLAEQEKIKKEAERKAKEEADRKEAERLAEIEKKRVADEKRAANKRHRDKVDKGIIVAFAELGMCAGDAIKFIEAANKGMILHVKIEY